MSLFRRNWPTRWSFKQDNFISLIDYWHAKERYPWLVNYQPDLWFQTLNLYWEILENKKSPDFQNKRTDSRKEKDQWCLTSSSLKILERLFNGSFRNTVKTLRRWLWATPTSFPILVASPGWSQKNATGRAYAHFSQMVNQGFLIYSLDKGRGK